MKINLKLELAIFIILSAILLFYNFERIIFLTTILIFIFNSIYNKCRNKEILINQEHEIFKTVSCIYLIIILICYLVDPMLLYDKNLGFERMDYYYLIDY